MDVEYYNKVFKESKDFNCHYNESKHFKMWNKAITWVNDGIVELGCGTGQFACMLNCLGFRDYKGYDYSSIGITKCLEKGLKDFYFEQTDILNMETISANTVVAFEFLEHVQKDMVIIDKIESGTRVLFSVPDFDEPSHVRTFKNKEKIISRYSYLLNIQEIICYPERNLKRFLVRSIKI